MKNCEDCRFLKQFQNTPVVDHKICKHQNSIDADAIMGQGFHPSYMRKDGYCGEKADWFEAKENANGTS